MARRSKLDEHADWLTLKSNLPTRKIAEEYNAQFGTTITHKAIAQWFQKRKAKEITTAVINADLVTKVTAEVLEGEWVRQLNEIRENYAKAKGEGDARGMAEWNRQAQFQVSMLLKAWQPIQQPTQVAIAVQIDKAAFVDEFVRSLPDDIRQRVLAFLRQ